MVRIEVARSVEALRAAEHLFDAPVVDVAAQRFLADPTHHLLIAYDDGGRPVGFVSGVEVTHPDKGTEMFLYELAVDESSRRRGIGAALVRALVELAHAAGCYGMWVLTDFDNEAAVRTYRAAGGAAPDGTALIAWTFDE